MTIVTLSYIFQQMSSKEFDVSRFGDFVISTKVMVTSYNKNGIISKFEGT